ncbi:sulfotransferase family protein [Microbacterium sp.]|uniref:sulfotransferase family protein n=1 Tax=Microbacterium sp. TaxID=51671 RepID=UPI003C1AD1D9
MRTDLQTIFIAGNSRSGTTVLSRVLGKHSAIHAFPELHFVEEMWDPRQGASPGTITTTMIERLLQNVDNRYFEPLTEGEYTERAQRLIDDLATDEPCVVFASVVESVLAEAGVSVACEQTPKNVYYIFDLLREFPQSRVVQIIRDPRDVVYSQKDWWKRVFREDTFPWRKIPWHVTLRRWAQYHPWVTAALWRGGVSAGLGASDDPRVVTILFEDFISEPELTLRPILALVDLDFESEMLTISGSNSSHQSGSAERTGLDKSVSGNWRTGLTRGEIWLVERQAFPLAGRMGYSPTARSMPVISVGLIMLTLPLKLAVTLLLRLGSPRAFVRAVRLRFGGASR